VRRTAVVIVGLNQRGWSIDTKEEGRLNQLPSRKTTIFVTKADAERQCKVEGWVVVRKWPEPEVKQVDGGSGRDIQGKPACLMPTFSHQRTA